MNLTFLDFCFFLAVKVLLFSVTAASTRVWTPSWSTITTFSWADLMIGEVSSPEIRLGGEDSVIVWAGKCILWLFITGAGDWNLWDTTSWLICWKWGAGIPKVESNPGRVWAEVLGGGGEGKTRGEHCDREDWAWPNLERLLNGVLTGSSSSSSSTWSSI